jgi:hypothetical protein
MAREHRIPASFGGHRESTALGVRPAPCRVWSKEGVGTAGRPPLVGYFAAEQIITGRQNHSCPSDSLPTIFITRLQSSAMLSGLVRKWSAPASKTACSVLGFSIPETTAMNAVG